MRIERCPVLNVDRVGDNIYVLGFRAGWIAGEVQPGQFVNIKVHEHTDPLLRRPFSVYRTEHDTIEIIFNVIGKGSGILSRKNRGDVLDVLGPLGVPFSVAGNYRTAVLVGGGLGVAPLPILTCALRKQGIRVVTLLGARTSGHIVETHLEEVHVATDDGSRGFHGTVVDLLRNNSSGFSKPKIFGCGPTAMLKALADYASEGNIPCEVSLEGPMACGFGICQGCPVELVDGPKKFGLVCKEGPTFDISKIRL